MLQSQARDNRQEVAELKKRNETLINGLNAHTFRAPPSQMPPTTSTSLQQQQQQAAPPPLPSHLHLHQTSPSTSLLPPLINAAAPASHALADSLASQAAVASVGASTRPAGVGSLSSYLSDLTNALFLQPSPPHHQSFISASSSSAPSVDLSSHQTQLLLLREQAVAAAVAQQ